MKYYHGSNVVYDFPDFDVIEAKALEDGKASKVVLGFYVTPRIEIARGCGCYVYEVQLHNWAIPVQITLDEMLKQYKSMFEKPLEEQLTFYKQMRQQYAEELDVLHIIEADGSIGESVILDLNSIKHFEIRR